MRTYPGEIETTVHGRKAMLPVIPELPSRTDTPYLVDTAPQSVDADSVAQGMLGDCRNYWVLVALNYGQFRDAFDIPAGIPLLYPAG